jgi:WD40 repeat protein
MRNLIANLVILLFGNSALAMDQKVTSIMQPAKDESLPTMVKPYVQAQEIVNTIIAYAGTWYLEKTIKFSDIDTPIANLVFSPSEFLLACRALDNKNCIIKHITNGAKAIKLACESDVLSVAVSTDGKSIAAGTQSGHVYLWDYNKDTSKLIKQFTELYEKAKGKNIYDCTASFLPNAQYLVGTITEDAEPMPITHMHSWGVKKPHYPHIRLKQQKDEPPKIAGYSGDGKYAAYYNAAEMKIDIYKTQLIQSLPNIEMAPKEILLSDKGNYLVVVPWCSSHERKSRLIQVYVKYQENNSYELQKEIEVKNPFFVWKLIISDDGLHIAWIEKIYEQYLRILKIYNVVTKQTASIPIMDNLVLQADLRFVKNSSLLMVGFTRELPEDIRYTQHKEWGDIPYICGFLDLKSAPYKWVQYIQNNNATLWSEKLPHAIASRQYNHEDFRGQKNPAQQVNALHINVEGLPVALSHDGKYLAIGMAQGRISLYKNLA